jgi:hypothetical protein
VSARFAVPGPAASGGARPDSPPGGAAAGAAGPRGKGPDAPRPGAPRPGAQEGAKGPDAAVAGDAPGGTPVASPPGHSPVAAGSPPPETPGAGTPPSAAPGEGAKDEAGTADAQGQAAEGQAGKGQAGKPDAVSAKPDETPGRPDEAAGKPEQAAGKPDQAAGKPEQAAGKPDQTAEKAGEAGGSPGQAAAPPASLDFAAERYDPGSAETIVLSAITEPPLRRRSRRQGGKRDHSDGGAEPSWATVLATTLRLWVQRRLVRHPWRTAVVLALVILVAAAAVTVALAQPSGPGPEPARSTGTASISSTAARALAAKARQQVAVWVSQEVSTDAIVACDPAMCAALQAQNVPASRVLVVRPGRGDPLGSDVVLATQAIRNQFGARLAGVYAPVVVAAFGSGAARIDVRVVAPDGTPDYLAALSADVKARVTAGSQLAHNTRIHTTATARAQLSAGLVDSRLLSALAALAAQHLVDLIGFGDLPGPAASPGVPLRSAVLAWAPRPGSHHNATLRSLLDFLHSQRPPYRPSVVKEVTSTAQRTVLRVEYSAPSPLGLLGSRG